MQTHLPSTGLLLIISGPSGVGKTTIAREVETQLHADFSVSVTTRAKTPTEVDGKDYHFVDDAAFTAMLAAGEFLEHAEVYPGCRYGTPRSPVEKSIAAGKLMILEIDVEGAVQVKAALPQAMAIFILPPNEHVVLERLRKRAREHEAQIQKRFAKAKKEILRAWESSVYDEFIVNRDLATAIAETVNLVRARLAR